MFVNLWVTTSCNFSCKYCYEGEKKKSFDLSKPTLNNLITHIIQEIKDVDEEIIIEFHGGEPLLNFPLIEYTVNKINCIFPKNKKRYGITTNAYYLDEKKADFLAEWMNFNLSISIDGRQEINDMYRLTKDGKGTFKIVKENAMYLLKKRKDVKVRMTILPETVKYLYDNCMDLIEVGFSVIGGSLDYYNSGWTKEHFEILYNELVKLYMFQKKYKNIRFPIVNYYCKKKEVCGFGKKYFNLYPNGDIYPCAYCAGDSNYIVGNINMEGFNMEKIYQFKEINRKINKECTGCSHIQNCISSRCKFINKSLTGDYFKPSPVMCGMENIKQRLSLFNI